MTPEKFVQERIHEVVSQAGKTGIKVQKVDEVISSDLRAAIQSGTVEPPDLIAFVRSTRQNMEDRSRRQRSELLLHVQDCLRGDTILGHDDPVLNTEAVLGKGQRKAWRWVTIEDGDAMLELQREHVEDAEKAYHANASAWATVKAAMRDRGIKFVGELWK